MDSGKLSTLDLKALPEPGSKYKLGLKIGGGVGGEVFEAVETSTGRKVAIKVVELRKETEAEIKREYAVLKELSKNENFPEFYDICLKKGKDVQKIWLVMEFCEGGTATDLVRKLGQQNKKMEELHIAYIMREMIKAVIHLHEKEISHRDIKGSNVLLTGDGRVKLIDFGISKSLERNRKMRTCVGSPSWLAPEVIACRAEDTEGYDKKADVWSIGITAIELGDGKAPFEDMHPGRALFQMVHNPPPTLQKPSDWSQIYNDFISECLVKDPDNRPFVQELLQHTFFQPIDTEENLLGDIEALLQSQKEINLYKEPEVQVKKGFMKIEQKTAPEKILQEDLASLTDVSEDSVLMELHERFKKNDFQTFIGDILLILNPIKNLDIYGEQYHKKYRFKGKSQNAPHIYSIAESAYRDVFHHEKPQHILFAGETGAGKTVNMKHAIDHFLFLGQGLKCSEKVNKALSVIHAMGNASTPQNANSTRHVLQTQMTFTETGKVSGAIFRVYQLEKERVTVHSRKQANFHIFYYFYDAIKTEDKLTEYQLNEETSYDILNVELGKQKTFKENVTQYQEFENNLRELEIEEEQINSIRNILSAVILLGEIRFTDDEEGNGVITTPDIVAKVAYLLGVDKKKLSWALLNYCIIIKGQAAMRHNSVEEAEEGKNVLARGLYSRLVDWVVNKINEKFSVSRVIYGDKHIIGLLDFYGFECYKKNTLNQLFVNTMNEQLQFYYNQKIFTWNKQIAEEEGGIPFPNVDFSDNTMVVDLIMSKPDGLLHKIDETTRSETSAPLIERIGRSGPIFAETSREFSINHYTGKLTYDASDMAKKNQDFLPPEIIDTMRLSDQELTKQLFSPLLSKSGNLSAQQNLGKHPGDKNKPDKSKQDNLQVNTTPQGQYSQSRQMRTAASTFRSSCIDILKNLTVREFGFHFVRCIRTDLSNKPGSFDPEVVRQQLRAMAVVNTVLTIQQGYSYSVSHGDFIRRYKFLAFDFDENVEETKENCRLLLLRLKLEGWTMGKTKVFLKYFNKEYLSRLYETQIKKIVKVQSMMRAFIARRKLYAKIRKYQVDSDKNKFFTEEDVRRRKESEAAIVIQKKFREYATNSKNDLTEKQKAFLRPWFKRWRAKSIFQVLLLYRAERLQTLVNFCLQIHIYNQNALAILLKGKDSIDLTELNLEAEPGDNLRPLKLPILKLPFMWESLNLRGDVSNCQPLPDSDIELLEFQMRKRENSVERPQENIPVKEIHEEDTVEQSEEHQSDQNTDSLLVNQNEENLNEETSQNAIADAQETNNSLTQENLTEESNNNSETAMNRSEEVNNSNSQQDQDSIIGDKAPDDAEFIQKENDENISKEETRAEPLSSYTLPVKSETETKNKIVPKQNFRTSINELEEKFRNTNIQGNGDDPPFNFRSLLRKTNYSTPCDSLFQNDDFFTSKRRQSVDDKNQRRYSGTIVTEIAPGILIHGQITDL